ncbi:ABC transporter family substrate-binding protein, partial [Streptomyces sp. WAC04770]
DVYKRQDLTPAAALRSWALANGSDEEQAEIAQAAREKTRKAVAAYGAEQKALRSYAVRKSLEPAYTQLALNGESGPLADDRVRRAVARALDRQELAETVLKPLGLPAKPLGSHLALAGQPGYKDGSGALGDQNTEEAQALLADAGWTRGGAAEKPKDTKAGSEAEKKGDKEDEEKKGTDKAEDKDEKKTDKTEADADADKKTEDADKKAEDKEEKAGDADKEEKKSDQAATGSDDSAASRSEGLYIVGQDNKPGARPVQAPAQE